MKQQPLPTLTYPILGLRQLRRAVGGKHRLDALNKRGTWQDRLDPIFGCVLGTALDARDTNTRRVAQVIWNYTRQGKPEERTPLCRLLAEEVLELIVSLSPQATSLDKAKRLVRCWAVQAHHEHQAELQVHHEAYLRRAALLDELKPPRPDATPSLCSN